jgi:acetyl-CoA carboxylase carboxyl transferase subunit alpha
MEFERPLAELEDKLTELRRLDIAALPELAAEIEDLEDEVERLRVSLYSSLTPWQKVQVSRHPDRPKTSVYVDTLFTDVVELRGDRAFGDDQAILTALATLDGRRVVVIGHRKGTNTKENVARNFGSPHPEGFRKARRAMALAAKFSLPVVTFLDTAGAYPGLEDEERGQAWAIAECLATLSDLPVPVVVVGIGEGGSGGALAIGFGDRLIMLENAYYSVISPEGCAAILWKDRANAPRAAEALKITAKDLLELGLADEIIPEPLGGAHNDPAVTAQNLKRCLLQNLENLLKLSVADRLKLRYAKYRACGHFVEKPPVAA